MIKFPNYPFWFEVEYDGYPVYTCFDVRDAFATVSALNIDSYFLDLFKVVELAISCYLDRTCLFSWVWNVDDYKGQDLDFDSAKVFKFFESVEVESYGGSEKS